MALPQVKFVDQVFKQMQITDQAKSGTTTTIGPDGIAKSEMIKSEIDFRLSDQ